MIKGAAATEVLRNSGQPLLTCLPGHADNLIEPASAGTHICQRNTKPSNKAHGHPPCVHVRLPARAMRPAIERPQVIGLHLPAVSANVAAAIRNAEARYATTVRLPARRQRRRIFVRPGAG
jgi:hypothetical protein